ncbi:MAG TPA: RNA polymerase sigma-70 factor [Bacteroidales bacterium]|nr:RNA polymerase sigma-70 factor [Bacteroidales bacterium]
MFDQINELRKGNKAVFEELFDKCYGPLCNYAYSILRDMDEAEDVVQKTFCKLWDQRASLFIKSSLDSYLYRIVHNDSINSINQRTLHQEHNFNYLTTVQPDSTNSVMESIETAELQDAIQRAIISLPPQCRRVFELSRMEQMPYSKIAEELQISTNTVENHMSKALKLLRTDLKEYLTFLLILQLLIGKS